ncbi:MAG: HEAT repeat domain-containing protein [Chloroflexi bacterium]|nr:HEAT repeat domain-containing protein [Chloroflexota bacterium]
MADFSETLRGVAHVEKPTTASLTFLSDMSSEDRAAFREIWPELSLERRKRIISNLVLMSEDNVDLDFRYALLAALEDSDSQVRQSAIEGLYEDNSKLLLGKLLSMLRTDSDMGVREAVARALGRFTYIAECEDKLGARAAELREALLEVARNQDDNIDVRRRAIESLGYLHNDSEVNDLIADIYEHGGRNAESAVFAMGRSMDPRWEQVILDELESNHPAMRYEAAHAAGEMVLSDALPQLVRMIEDRDLEVRLAAIWALGQIGGKPATEALSQALQSDEPAIKEAAQEAMGEISFSANPLNPI